jgi:hypothetical protein
MEVINMSLRKKRIEDNKITPDIKTQELEKMEQLLGFIENPQKIVENFGKVYKTLKSTNKYLDEIYRCLMSYTTLVQGIGLPGILPKDKYNQMTAATAQMKERNKQFTADYRATMNNLEREIMGETQQVLKPVK